MWVCSDFFVALIKKQTNKKNNTNLQVKATQKKAEYLSENEFKNKLIYEGELKSTYDDIISAIDTVFDQWNPGTATLIEELCRLQRGLCWKINLI